MVVEDGKGRTIVLCPPHHGFADSKEVESLCLRGMTLRVLRAFLKGHPKERIELYFGPDSLASDESHLALVAYDCIGDGYDKLKIWQSGIFSITVYWGSQDFWDQWVVDPQSGEVTYTGTVDGYRRLPAWLEEVLA
jgi:hypothetical protein